MPGYSDKEENAMEKLPESWKLFEAAYSIEHKLAEIEHENSDFYDYGKAFAHAGPVPESIRKEIDRMHKLLEFDHRLANLIRLGAEKKEEKQNRKL
ncbi:MAG: hypothetical protein QS98_C0005G0109 [archaeon GW2011_AR3]|nr:MAG: hypothetical protein QS98_C0005G0109 [archaeon GW2011_AR3]